MLKWAVQTRRRRDSADGDSTSILSILPELENHSANQTVLLNRQRPKSLFLDSSCMHQENDINGNKTVICRRQSSPLSETAISKAHRAKRHSMVFNSSKPPEFSVIKSLSAGAEPMKTCIDSTNNLSLNSQENSGDILKITTQCGDKSKRNSFWKSLRHKAGGKKEQTLSKAQSLSYLPAEPKLSQTIVDIYCDISRDCSDQRNQESGRSTESQPEDSFQDSVPCSALPMGLDTTAYSTTKRKVQRRRSFKMIKKQNENKKPKPFTKLNDDTIELTSGSPDSGISGVRNHSVSDEESTSRPVSPVSPIDMSDSALDLNMLGKQLTETVLQYLQSLDKRSQSELRLLSDTRSVYDSGLQAGDVFCYDSSTIIRKRQQSAADSIH